jgi:uncharacterized RDD family membrane protein YckC/cytoskeletal protein CcmA (bactofilin family)
MPDMSFLVRYSLIALVGFRCTLFAQPAADEKPAAAPGNEESTPAKQAAVQNDRVDAPPDEPVEVPVKKPRRRNAARAQLHVVGMHHSNTVFGQNVLVKAGESIEELVLLGGNADIQGTVERDVVIIGGSARVSGNIEGQLVLVGGTLDVTGQIHRGTHAILSRVTASESANFDRGVVFLGGPFKIDPGTTILGERIMIPLGDFVPHIEGLKAWLIHGLLWGRLLPMNVHWPWMVAAFFTGLYFLALLLFPGAIKAIFLALEARPITSVLSGFLTLILFAPLVAILVIAVVGIPVIPFLQVALILALLFGKAAVMCFLGRSFGRSAGAAFLQTPLAAFVIGASLLVLAYMIPIFGVLAWILATVFGLGGAVVAIARTFKREEGTVPTVPVYIGQQPAGASAGIAASGIAAPGIASSGFVPPSIATPAINPPLVGDVLLMPRAGFWKRLLADLLDFILLLVIGILLVPLIGKAFVPLIVGYFVGMWAWRGTTIGSLLLRLKVVRTDGSPVTVSVALVRSLSSLFSLLVLGLGFLWTAWDRDKQSWHDKIAGTVVVQMPKGFALI